jgi:ATP/maltotriose-dependent transcriptional regulator MalT/DNA-binding SARP family transcriptional activator
VHERRRLFELLDAAIAAPAVWVEAAPGAGKTTLAASWLDARSRPSVWHQVDASDSDLPTFFHYLSLSTGGVVSRHKQPLPHLTPEYLPNLEIFARRYFEEVFRRVPDGTVLVFDNVQDAGSESAFHDVLRIAMECVPAHARVLCLSRTPPPAQFARLRANGSLTVLERETVRLTLDEALAIALLRGSADPAKVATIHELTRGWAAGLVLMIESTSEIAPDYTHPETLFGYFASEVLHRLDEATRDVLTKSAILTKMRARDVEALTGNENAGRVLADLARRNYFTYRLSPREPTYEYHPLFREFLLLQLRETVAPENLRSQQSAAARLLEAAGLAEDAADLWTAAADHAALAPHIVRHAAHLIAEGRSHVVEAWLAAVPADRLHSEPWLQYWSGICRLAFSPAGARASLEAAFLLFERKGDAAGMYESWASIVDSIVYEWSDFHPLDRWLDTFERLRRSHPEFPSAAIEAHVATSVLNALMWRRPGDPSLPAWAERVKQLALDSADIRFRVVAGNHLTLYYLWMGQFASATLIVETLRPTLEASQMAPLVRLTWYVMEAMHAWFTADSRACIAAVESGARLADECGVHLHDLYLHAQAVYCGLSLQEPSVAAQHLKRMASVNTPRRTDHSLLQYQMAAAAWCRKDFAVAAEHAAAAARIASETGAALLDGFCHTELALFLFSAGRREEAQTALARGRQAGRGMNHVEYLGSLYGAWFAQEQGFKEEALVRLRAAFSLAARQGYVNSPHWAPTMMAKLCAHALEHDVEPEYVKALIGKRGLVAPESLSAAESWPWPVRVFALGRLRLEAAGVTATNQRKSPRKPLELLALLIASGEAGVSSERAVEALWPDLDGTKSREAVRVALYRLRRLLGGEDRVITAEGRMALNAALCWVDAWVFERALDAAGSNESVARALALYRGPFLDDDHNGPWALICRERLQDAYVRAVLATGARLEQDGDLEQALACYQRGLQHGGLVEAFYQRVIACCTTLGRRAEGLTAYARCREHLREALGVSPAEQTERLHSALLAGTS